MGDSTLAIAGFNRAMAELFRPIEAKQSRLADSDFDMISRLLIRVQKPQWSCRPRTYAVLRMIDRVDLFEDFILEGLKDIAFPYTESRLPNSLSPTAKGKFLQAQKLVLTKASDLEKSDGRHRHLEHDADVHFDILKPLGRGGFGEVHHVKSKLSLDEFARKRVHRRKAFSKDREAIETFENELTNLKRLSHHHLVKFMGSYTDPKYVGILISPVADCDLKAFLEKKPFPKVDLHLLRGFFGCLCSAVLYLHQSKCRHKDLKPRNVLIYMNNVLITDFGTARDWSERSHSTTTGRSGAFTAGYAAPEVVCSDPRSSSADIWSLGCVYLDMMTVLRGETLTSKCQFFTENGTGGANPRNNAEALELWLARLRSETDKQPLEWIREMTKTARNDRITTAELMAQIHSYDSQVYYNSCCSREEESESGTSYKGSIWEDASPVKGSPDSTETQRDDEPAKTVVPTSSQDLNKESMQDRAVSLGLINGKSEIDLEAVSQHSDAAPECAIATANQLLLDKGSQRAQEPIDASLVNDAAVKVRGKLEDESLMPRNQVHRKDAEKLDVQVMATRGRVLEYLETLQAPEGPMAVCCKRGQYDGAEQPGRKLVVSASRDKTVRLWGSTTGALCSKLEGHSSWVNAVAFSPDGKLVVSASGDRTVRLWDSVTGMPWNTLEGHSDSVYAVAFSQDGKLVASASGDKMVRLWDSATGKPRNALKGHSDSIYAVAFSLDGKLIASASGDNTVRLWDSATGVLYGTLKGHLGMVYAVAFSPDNELVVSASGDKTVRLWDSTTGVLCSTLEGHSESVYAVAFSPNGKLVASASYDKTVKLWDSATGALHSTLKGHSNSVFAVAFSPDGKLVASASGDETVRLWDSGTGISCTTLEGHSHSVNAVAFSPDGKLVASASRDKTVRLWGSTMGGAESYPLAS